VKKTATVLALLVAFGLLGSLLLNFGGFNTMTLVVSGNTEQKPLPFELGTVQDAQCGMIVDAMDHAGEVVAPDGRTWFYHDIGGIPLWLEEKSFRDTARIWVMAQDTKQWIDGRTAWYSRTDETPMHYGFGAHARPQEGFVDYDTMRLMMLRGENLTNPFIKKQLLGH